MIGCQKLLVRQHLPRKLSAAIPDIIGRPAYTVIQEWLLGTPFNTSSHGVVSSHPRTRHTHR